MKRLVLLATAILVLAVACTHEKTSQGPTPEDRARQLISQLTLEDKTALMRYDAGGVEALGIQPYNWWNEALHGVARNGKATTFPQPIGMAASFDEPLVEEVFTAVSDEARVKHRQAVAAGESGWYQGLTFWTPNINIFRDPRWGRGMETYGEDPYLTGQLGMAVVRGLQGDPDAPVLKAHACAKHFAVHSGPEWNRHSFDAEVSDRDLRETYLPAFKDLVTKAGVQEVMIAYNRFRGVPCGANTFLIDTVLRGEWNYKGLVVSDCWAIHDFFMPGRHGYSPDVEHAVSEAVRAGTDLNCGESYRHIPETVAAGLLDEAELEPALTRVLAARIRLGELDAAETPWDELGDEIVEGPEHLALARRIAQESIVLLQNRDAILPLQADAKIALVGPNADDREMLWGNYNPIPEQTITLADALRARVPELTVLPGCDLVSPDPLSEKDVAAVLKQLEGVEVVVFAGGISPRVEGEEMPVALPGFRGGDRTDIELPAVQRQLLAALHAAGKRIVLVNFSGSAIGLVPETETCEAIVQAWYPGQEGGTALAGILFGDVAPSGKLPVTFYRSIDQVPDYEDYAMRGRTYRYFAGEPLFPFGYGLSYTTFSYGEARVKRGVLEIPVTNTGTCDADEVVQLYVRRPADNEGPLKSLRGFRRVHIPAGATVKVSFPLTAETFLSWSPEAGDMVPMKGEWQLLYGGSSADASLKQLNYKY
jgi:Beta-glucosidase-related glycosidases